MTSSARLYDKTVLQSNNKTFIPGSKTYKGFSTVSNTGSTFGLYDISLIKQDLLNHFNIRFGERLEQPEFGTIIWDLLWEPLTNELKALIAENVKTIINYDPRISTDQIIVSTYESGIQIECILTFFPYNIQEALQLRFDQANGLLA